MKKSAAHYLEAVELDDGWTIVKKYDIPENSTGGNFSVGYLVTNKSTGQRGFLKALDYTSALRHPNTPEMLSAMTDAFIYERDLLYKCKNYRLRNVIVPLAYGSTVVAGHEPLDKVDYLIIELADCDARQRLSALDRFDIAWRLRCLHYVAKGLMQLHLKGIAHQDLKPSNVLVFDSEESKVGDLGRCSMLGATPRHDSLEIAGDPDYAPPELLYHHINPDWRTRRCGCDLYLLGSLTMFFFTSTSMTASIIAHLDPGLRPQAWTGSYREVLPHIVNAWTESLSTFCQDIDQTCGNLCIELSTLVKNLTHPDPELRGHPMAMWGLSNRFSLERFVSAYDLLARKAEKGRF